MRFKVGDVVRVRPDFNEAFWDYHARDNQEYRDIGVHPLMYDLAGQTVTLSHQSSTSRGWVSSDNRQVRSWSWHPDWLVPVSRCPRRSP